jgi:hypothetical protein
MPFTTGCERAGRFSGVVIPRFGLLLVDREAIRVDHACEGEVQVPPSVRRTICGCATTSMA